MGEIDDVYYVENDCEVKVDKNKCGNVGCNCNGGN